MSCGGLNAFFQSGKKQNSMQITKPTAWESLNSCQFKETFLETVLLCIMYLLFYFDVLSKKLTGAGNAA